MENMSKRLTITVPKWVKNYLPKLFAQAQKFGIWWKKPSLGVRSPWPVAQHNVLTSYLKEHLHWMHKIGFFIYFHTVYCIRKFSVENAWRRKYFFNRDFGSLCQFNEQKINLYSVTKHSRLQSFLSVTYNIFMQPTKIK